LKKEAAISTQKREKDKKRFENKLQKKAESRTACERTRKTRESERERKKRKDGNLACFQLLVNNNNNEDEREHKRET
jgi:hypothetical protein